MKILKGNLVSAPALGKLEIVEHGCLVLHDDGSIQSVEKAVPQNADAEVIDYGDSLSCRLLSTCTCTRRSTPCSAWAWTCR